MVMMDAFATQRASEVAAVATFDHGTGSAASRAARLVERTALACELPVVSGRSEPASAVSEGAWRMARWRFLRGWAEELKATIVTAHTRDDQIETVVLRILRGSGARGLAGMLAEAAGVGPPVRPLLEVPRADVVAYARARAIPFHEDPSNASLTHQRNRVRREILPALESAQPGFSEWCWDLGRRAAHLRVALAAVVDQALAPTRTPDGALVFGAGRAAAFGAAEWVVIWPELAARVGVALDRRGIERAAAWAPTARRGSQIPLAGGAAIERTVSTFVVRGADDPSHLGWPRIYIEGNDE